MVMLTRLTIVAFASLLALGFKLAPLDPGEQDNARSLVEHSVNGGLSILNDALLSEAEQHEKFRSLFLSVTNMQRIALFTLGRHRRGISTKHVDAFVAAFTDYSIAFYENHLLKGQGTIIRITGTAERSPTETIVNAVLINATAKQPTNIAFRVVNNEGRLNITDMQFEGMWFSIYERDEFGVILQQNGENLPLLTVYLRNEAERLHPGGKSP